MSDPFFGPGIRYGFSGRADGNMSLKTGDVSSSGPDRSRFLSSLGIDRSCLVLPIQVHSAAVAVVGSAHKGRGADSAVTGIADTDALITAERGVCVGVQTADCLPLLIHDPVTGAVAAVHAGWRSTAGRIAALAVGRLASEFGSRPRDLRCLLGPSIGPCCYAVGEEFASTFPRSVERRGGRLYLDLAGENLRQLMDSGVAADNIGAPRACTCCSKGFFSFRRDGASCGRMLSVIMRAYVCPDR